MNILNRITSAYLEFAELQAIRQVPMTMKDWIVKLDDFIKMTGSELLENSGTISKLEAENNLQRQAQFLQNSKQMLANMAERLLSILNKMETILPKPVAAVFNAAVNSILKPIMTII